MNRNEGSLRKGLTKALCLISLASVFLAGCKEINSGNGDNTLTIKRTINCEAPMAVELNLGETIEVAGQPFTLKQEGLSFEKLSGTLVPDSLAIEFLSASGQRITISANGDPDGDGLQDFEIRGSCNTFPKEE